MKCFLKKLSFFWMKYRIWKSMKPFFSKMMRFRESEQGIFFQKKLQRISFYLEKLIKLSDVGVRSSELLDYHSIYASEIWNTHQIIPFISKFPECKMEKSRNRIKSILRSASRNWNNFGVKRKFFVISWAFSTVKVPKSTIV